MNPHFKNILLLFFLNCTVLHIIAQPDLKDAEQAYQYWGQRGIIEAVFSYMQDYSRYNPLKPQERLGMNSYEEKFIKYIDEKSVNDIDKLYGKLHGFLHENSWKFTADKIVIPLMGNYSNLLALNSSFFSILDQPGNKYIETVNSINVKYKNTLHLLKNKAIGNAITDAEQVETKVSLSVVKKTANYLLIVVCLVTGILLGGLIVYFYIKRRIYQILKEEKSYYKEVLREERNNKIIFGFVGLIEILKQHKDDYKKSSEQSILQLQINNLKNENDNFKKQVSDLKQINDSLNSDLKNIREANNAKKIEESIAETSSFKKILYYNIPGIDGSFKVEEAREHKEQDCFYKLEFTNSKEGYVYFISGDYDLRAIENIDYYINPVCEVQNIGNRVSSRKVQMISRGSFSRNGNYWQVYDKIKINLV